MPGLSGASFTGYPLPDVAAGINLKNQVTHWIELCQRWKVGSALKHLQGQIFKKDLFGKESAAGRNLRKRMSGTAEVLLKKIFLCKNMNTNVAEKLNLHILPEQENSELLTEAFENPESTPVHLPRQADDKSSIIRKSI